MEWQQVASMAGTAWFSIALLGGGLAGLQGRGKFWWFLMTLIFGPLALFFLVIWTEPLKQQRH
ncbi:hypothetical protein [Microbacterium sp. H1-D42]|uniref:hypothetical protein n=1 Tax=Microbacterium sp. H1-D42 TaxID=2925844 RepID=UPI001F535CC4|nr:hypothetical protein [Microbacterium sp. H1-D42]UNK70530.1 hypothetical protein MNR00_15425 [Microbacterium sp. H1-D42]